MLGFVARPRSSARTARRPATALRSGGLHRLRGLGAAVSVALFVGVAATVDHVITSEYHTTTVAYGASVRVSPALDGGVRSVTVYSVAPAASSASLAVARIQVCSGNERAPTGLTFLFDADLLFDTTPRTALPSVDASVPGAGPNLANFTQLPRNWCRTGYLAFPSKGRGPMGLQYSPLFHGSITWVP